MINAGADVAQANWSKKTPLHLAASYGRLDVVDILVTHGAPIDIQDSKGYTPLHYAAENNRREIVEYLIINKANHLILNNDGLKAYEVAPEPLKSELTEFVISKLMSRARSLETDEPLLTPGKCVFCQAAVPVLGFKPCPHIQLCDNCYINHKYVLKTCPICKKNLKWVEFLNPPPDPDPIEEEPEEEDKPEPPPQPPAEEEEEKVESARPEEEETPEAEENE